MMWKGSPWCSKTPVSAHGVTKPQEQETSGEPRGLPCGPKTLPSNKGLSLTAPSANTTRSC